MQSPLSINVKPYSAQGWPECLEFLRDLDPTVIVAAVDQFDHFNRILEVKALLPNAVKVARFIDKKHDGEMHLKPKAEGDKNHYIVSPRNHLNRIKQYGQDGLIAYWGNEPSGEVDLYDKKRLVAHTIEAMDLAVTDEYKMRLCVLNWGVGHPLIDADGCLDHTFDPLLMRLNDHHNTHYYGMHCYAPADFIGRLLALKNSCTYLGIPMPRVIITEFGYDTHAGSKEQGFKSRGMSAEDYAKFCVDAVNGPYAEWLESGDVLGLCTFIYGDFPSWPSFDVETAEKGEVSTAWRDGILRAKREGKLDLLRNLPPTPIPIPDAVPNKRYTLHLPGKMIVGRMDHSVTAPTMGTIPDGAVVLFYEKDTDNVGAWWLKVKYSAITHWIPAQGVKLVEYLPPTVPPPIPDPPPPEVTLPLPYIRPFNEVQVKQLESWRDKLRAELQMVEYMISLQSKAALINAQVNVKVSP